jgi:queuine tRNA-ribosyltransferase
LEAKRQLDEEHGPARQALFGIIQGGSDLARRLAHAEELAELPFEGLALGGFSVGEPIETMHEVLAELAPKVDPARPRYLMGVGKPVDLVRGIQAGVDMFDCVLPTRNARNGQALTRTGRIVLKHARHKNDPRPLEDGCPCPTCTAGYSRGYLRHLFNTGELLGLRLVSMHNLVLYGELTSRARRAIIDGRFQEWKRSYLDRLAPRNGDDAKPVLT